MNQPRRFASRDRLPVVALVCANLAVALLSVLRGWGYYEMLLIYWLEALVIGGFNVLRLLVVGMFGDRPLGDWFARHVEVTPGARLLFTLVGTGVFVAKFGGFALVVGLFAILLPASFSSETGSGAGNVVAGLGAAGPGVAIAVGLLVLSHGFSFARNFIVGREYARLSVPVLIFLPYARMSGVALVLVVGLVIARFVPGAAGATTFAVLMVLVKLGVDTASHLAEHRWLAERPDVDGGQPWAG